MPDRHASPDPVRATDRRESLSPAPLASLATAAVVLLAFILYAAGAAPGLTWAHQGADGGELVTAAVVNGVPHPPGYPLYIMLLQAWLWLARSFGLRGDLNWQAALFSALCAALSVGVTLRATLYLGGGFSRRPTSRKTDLQEDPPPGGPPPLLYAALAAAAWAISPLLWSQAVIAEVYALHALLLTLLGWVVLVHPTKLWYVTGIVALGVANHLTTVLLLPAAAYAVWWAGRRATHSGEHPDSLWRIAAAFGAGLLLGALIYLRIPLAAGGAPPVNWGYADNWQGFWWLVSGSAYRGYLFSDWPGALPAQLAGWAYTITAQYTPLGLAVALVGLAYWDRAAGWLRNFSLLWLLPVSAYAIAYYTRDSDIYLLPVGWLMALWLAEGFAVGLAQIGSWLTPRRGRTGRGAASLAGIIAGIASVGLIGLAVWRWPQMALAADHEARDYLAQATSVLEPNSIVVTLDDRETFAFWYGVWGSREVTERAPGVTPINDSLYQFDWYRRLQGDLHPAIGGIGESVDAVIAANRGDRPIFFAQLPANVAESELTPAGPLWRLKE